MSDTPNFLAAPCNSTVVFDRNMGLLNHFVVILVYTVYSSFNYIRESSSIWSHTGRYDVCTGLDIRNFEHVAAPICLRDYTIAL